MDTARLKTETFLIGMEFRPLPGNADGINHRLQLLMMKDGQSRRQGIVPSAPGWISRGRDDERGRPVIIRPNCDKENGSVARR